MTRKLLKRRSFIRTLIAVLALVSVLLLDVPARLNLLFRAKHPYLKRFYPQTLSSAEAVRIGKAYLSQGHGIQEIEHELGIDGMDIAHTEPVAETSRITALIAEDLARNRFVSAAGWELTVTEARLFGLAA